MEQYSGIKHADDTNDAFFLAELLRLKILPTGHIYDAELRPVRDLLRRRLMLVHQRTALMLSFKSLYTRTTGQEMTLSELKELEIKEAQNLYEHPANQLIAGMQIKHIEQLTESIEKIEKVVLGWRRELPYYEQVATLPGVGKILGMTITMEVGDIKRFAGAGPLCQLLPDGGGASACPTASRRERTTPNAATSIWPGRLWKRPILRGATTTQCRKWFERKAAKTSNVIATKALACKLAKAAWYLMAEATRLRSQADVWATGKRRNENLNFGARPPASEGVGLEPSGLIGGGRAPLTLAPQWNCWKRSFAGDSTVP